VLSPVDKDPVTSVALGKGGGGLGRVEGPLEEVLGENFRIAYVALPACGCEGLRLMLWG